MNKSEYLNRAAAEVAKARKRLPAYAGECAACRWSKKTFIGRDCQHPAVVCAAFNISDAYARDRIQDCDEQRVREGVWGPVLCGPDGALFEKKEPWWSGLFGRSERTGA